MIRLRTLAALLAGTAGAAAFRPTELPSTSALQDSEVLATELATLGLRLVAAGLCGYVTLVLLVVLLAELRVLPSALRRSVDRWTSRGLAGTVRHLVGASVLATGVVPFAPTLAHATESPPPVMAPFDDPVPTSESRTSTTSPPQMVPTEEPPPTTARPPRPPVRRTPRPPEEPSRPRVEPPPAAARHPSQVGRLAPTHTVRPGESFWSIAEDLVALRLGRTPTDPEVIGPWLDLIARNTHVLADPSDPDLLDVGVVLHLPPPRGVT